MGCATSMVKYLLFLFNLAFVLAAIAFITVGVIFKINITEYTEAIDSFDSVFGLAPTLLIVVGVVVLIISFFGCCGAVREGTCMLTTYAIILLTIFILQVALGVYAFLQFKDNDVQIKDEINKGLLKTLKEYEKNDGAREAIDTLQHELECCGVTGPGDWTNEWHNGSVPTSCCPNQPPQCYPVNAYKEGCTNKFFDFLKSSAKTVGIVVIVIGAVELAGAIIALCLASSIRNHERRGGYA